MNFIDVLIIIPLIYGGYKGFKHGLIIEVFTMLALFVGLYAGINFSDFVAAFFKKSFSWDSEYLPIIFLDKQPAGLYNMTSFHHQWPY